MFNMTLREYGEYIISMMFVPIDIWYSLLQVFFGIYDQTHYYVDSIKSNIGIIITIFNEYIQSIPRHFIAHHYHQQYLRKLGFPREKSLIDTGKLTWNEEKLKGKGEGVTGILDNASGNYRHLSIASLALDKMWRFLESQKDISIANSIFVDFGCGTGLAVLSALTYPFLEVIGVELDVASASLAETNVERFKKSKLLRCKNVKILCQDMINLEFSSIGCTEIKNCNMKRLNPILPTIILYLYEPLWTLAKEDAILKYREILRNAKSSGRKIIVMYFYAGVYSGDALPVFEELGSTLLFKEKYHSLFFGPPEDLYIYNL